MEMEFRRRWSLVVSEVRLEHFRNGANAKPQWDAQARLKVRLWKLAPRYYG